MTSDARAVMEYADGVSGFAGVEEPQPRRDTDTTVEEVEEWRSGGIWWYVDAEPPQ